MKRFVADLESTSPYSQSRFYEVPKLEREQPADYEERTWRERLHVDKNGEVYIPPMAFKNCLSDAAKYMSVQIPGKGKATYTKHIEAGVIVVQRTPIGIHKEQVRGEWLHLPSDGKRGGSKRVKKCMPIIDEWKAAVEFLICDEIITKEVFERHIKAAGDFIGIGRFRPRNNGYYGRFIVNSVEELTS